MASAPASRRRSFSSKKGDNISYRCPIQASFISLNCYHPVVSFCRVPSLSGTLWVSPLFRVPRRIPVPQGLAASSSKGTGSTVTGRISPKLATISVFGKASRSQAGGSVAAACSNGRQLDLPVASSIYGLLVQFPTRRQSAYGGSDSQVRSRC